MAYFCPHCGLLWDDDILDSISDIGCPSCQRTFDLEDLEQEMTIEEEGKLWEEGERLRKQGYFDKKLYEKE